MDASEMRELLTGYLGEIDWNKAITKDDLVEHLAGRDETLRTMVNEYVAEGSYRDLNSVITLIPEQAWQDAQGDIWRGPDAQFAEDIPSNFQAGAVGQDDGNVYHRGGPTPRTPGFGRSSGADHRSDEAEEGFGDAGSNAGEVDPGLAVKASKLTEAQAEE